MTQRLDLTPLRVQALSFEAHPATARMTDSSLFARFVAQQGTEKSWGCSESFTRAGTGCDLLQAIGERCGPRWTRGVSTPMQFVISLARRGRINVRAHHEYAGWTFSLEAEQSATHQWLIGQQPDCQARLSRTLGQSVRVLVIQERVQ